MKSRMLAAFAIFSGVMGVMLIFWLLPGPAGSARTVVSTLEVCVSGPPTCAYDSIQDAVDAAGSGDIVKVAAGTYTGTSTREGVTQMVYISKSVSIEGGYTTAFAEPANPVINQTVLDAQENGRLFYITGPIGVVLDGLYLTGGDATGLGGAYWGDDAGGGLYLITATLSLDHCMIYGNIASTVNWGWGGGLYMLNSSNAGVYYNTILSNTASSGGEGDYDGYGGGIAVTSYSGSVQLSGNLVQGNIAATDGNGQGGGIYLEGGSPELWNNVVRNNYAGSNVSYDGEGGGIYLWESSPRFFNTVLVNNVSGFGSTSFGSGLYMEDSSPLLEHTTIQGNLGIFDGVGIYASTISTGSAVVMTNTILANQDFGAYAEFGSAITLTEVLWYANSIANTGGSGTITYTNAITANPSFFPDGYHIMLGSPAVDNGLDIGVAYDVDDQSRPQGSGVDLGADELLVVTGTVDVNNGATLVYTDTGGTAMTVEIPTGAVTEATAIALTPLSAGFYPMPAGTYSIGFSFELGAYRNGGLLPGFEFEQPVLITLKYLDSVVLGLQEDELRLYFWDGMAWVDGASTCSPTSTYVRDLVNNILSVEICHTSRWDFGGPQSSGNPTSTPTPTATGTITPTVTMTATATPTPTITPTGTLIPEPQGSQLYIPLILKASSP